MESHFQNESWKGRRSGRAAKFIVWKRKNTGRCNNRASRGRKKGGGKLRKQNM